MEDGPFFWWQLFGGAIMAGAGVLAGAFTKGKVHDSKIQALEANHSRLEGELKGMLVRVEDKIDRLNDHFVGKAFRDDDEGTP